MKAFVARTLPGRILAGLALGLVLGWLLSEASFLILKDTSDRVPGLIELVIPAGTAEHVAAGESPPSIPADMTFLVGDTLVVRNEDSVNHQLGPLFIPPGASAQLAMTEPNSYAYECSFQPNRYLDLDVQDRVTWLTRVQAMILTGPPMAALFIIYSLVIWPLKPRGPQAPSSGLGTGPAAA